MRPGRIVLTVVGALLALFGLVAVAAGATLIWADATQRDAAGYYNTSTALLQSPGYALSGSVDFGFRPSEGDWVPTHPAGTVRIRAADPAGRAIFIGIAPSSQVDAWLGGVSRTVVRSLPGGPFERDVTEVAGSAVPGTPDAQLFWAARTSGPGLQTLAWDSRPGKWAAVVMNADGSPGVAANVSVGVDTGLLLPIGLAAGGFGILVLAGAALMLYLGLRTPGEQVPAGAEWAGRPASEVRPGAYPLRLEGHVDPATSRWLWLIKWLLVIPHLVVLALLWMVVAVLTVIAGFAILFTGRYPRGIFDFNVGVFRWTWRVSFYALSAFGTDRYPPFSLREDPTYPADLSLDYPERLSRGLVLVKWWLLALPHYVIVGFLVGGWGYGWSGSWRSAGGGLIAVLAIIAAVIRGVRGRYPDQLFDLIMGLNRWCYRVLAYAALMTDEYPPFRLDGGGSDPGHRPTAPPPGSGPPAEPPVSPPRPVTLGIGTRH